MTIHASHLIEEDGGDHARDVADQQGCRPGRQSERRHRADQRRIEREEGDQVPGIADRSVTVSGEVDVVTGIPLIPGLAECGQGVGGGAELDQGQRNEHGFDQQRERKETEPGADPVRREPGDRQTWRTIATRRPAGHVTE